MENPYQAPASLNLTPNAPFGSNDLVSPEVIRSLQGTKGWVRFLAVLGFIATAFMVIGAIGIVATMNRSFLAGLAVAMGGTYLVAAGFNFFAAFKLNQYASRISTLLLSPSELNLVSALEAQRGFWKYVGIMMIVVIVMYLFVIFFAFA